MNYQELQEAKQTFRLHALEKEMKPLFKAREDFVRRFNPKKIASMTIDEYVQGKQSKTSFCYILERTLKGLGNVSGQYATKFGVWYSSEQQTYRFEKRLGDDYKQAFKKVNMDVYGRKCTKTLMMLLELKYHSDEREIGTGIINIEHILPQNPGIGSEWTINFTPEQRNLYTHKIGNLCLLTRKKNSSFSNLRFSEKKLRYFNGKIDTLPRTLKIVNSHEQWLPKDIEYNQKKALEDIREIFEIHDVTSVYDDAKELDYIQKAKLTYSMAYEKWTEEDEAKLVKLFLNNVSIEDIMNELGRNHGAIMSRLKKLGIVRES